MLFVVIFVNHRSYKRLTLHSTQYHITSSAAWRSGLERRFYDEHDRKVHDSIHNLVSLLRPWISCFAMIISAW